MKFLLLSLILLITPPLFASDSYAVKKVIDGDTLEITNGNIYFRVRLAGIDAPEKETYWGRIAKIHIEELVSSQKVELKQYLIDPYNRIVADIKIGEMSLSKKMIEDGYAEYFRVGCKDYRESEKSNLKYDILPYVKLEKLAREKKLNIWSAKDYVSPCKYRKNKKSP